MTTALLPLLWAAHHVIKSLFSTAAGGLSDRVDRRWLLVAGWTSYAIIYAAFPYAHSLTAFFVLFIVYAIPFTLAEGAERAWIADLVPAEVRGKSFGVYYLANGLGVLAGTALFGLIYERVSPRAAFNTGAALAIAAVIAVLVTRKRGGGDAARPAGEDAGVPIRRSRSAPASERRRPAGWPGGVSPPRGARND